MDGLADIHVYKEVAAAKLTIKKPNLFLAAKGLYERGEDD
jgi:hypothetical protein